MTDMLIQNRPIRLKGRSFLAIALSPELPFADWVARLDDLAARSAGFFLKRPIVLDVNGLDIDHTQLRELVDLLATRNVRIMGIEGARPSLLGPDMPPAMTDGRQASDVELPLSVEPGKPDPVEPVAAPDHQSPTTLSSLVIKQPVRSGQSLFHPDGDVTVIGSVASGAEVVASGSIHVYGPLRGRAMAGTMGNSEARIFCRKLEAELIAIDGYYMTADDMEPKFRGKAVQMWLEDGAIKTEILG